MRFDLNDLRLFVLVAEEGTLTRAAVRQHLSLAAASARIKALEEQSGVPLLYREARGVRLAPPGEAFLHHARGLLHQAEQLRRDLHDYSGGLRGHVRVLANTTAVTDFLPEVLPGFLARNPRINVDLQEKPNAEIARGVLDGRADVGIVAGKIDVLGLHAIHFSTDRLVLVTARNHRFARRKRIAFTETLGEDMVGMHHGSTLQDFLERHADILGKTMKVRVQLSSFDAMCRMVSGGVGVAVVPESAARRSVKSMKLAQVELADAWRVRERYILVRELEDLPAFARSLIDELCQHFRGGEGSPR
jgi:DNA-binding transcriptional LysR family regulator